MTHSERAIQFKCAGETLVGVASLPATPRDTGVVIVVGGPQYRAGSHRQFVGLARHLAADGYPALRFDVRGMGDSTGTPQSFEHLSADLGCAIDALFDVAAGLRRVILWGLCDGASAALLYVAETGDPRVAGLALANPWVRSELGLARTQVKHYYARRLLQGEFWAKLVRGQVAADAFSGLARNLRVALSASTAQSATESTPVFQHRMANAWMRFNGPVLLLLSGRDQTAEEFVDCVGRDPAWTGALLKPNVRVQKLGDADHTMSSRAWKSQAEALTIALMEQFAVDLVEPSTV